MLKHFLFYLFLTLYIVAISQDKKVNRYISFGPSIVSYKGDLNEKYTKTSGAISVMLVPEKDKLLQSTIELNVGTVVGQNNNYYSERFPEYEPNTYFQSSIASLSFNIRAYFYRKNNLKMYVGQGFGILRYTPKDESYNKLIDNTDSRVKDETYNDFTLILPRTLGVSYRLKNNFRLSFDINQQAPRTDYLDNISKLGESDKKDKILLVRFSILVPISYQKEKEEELP